MKYKLLNILVILLISCNSESNKSPDWEIWQSQDGSISISHPKDWILWNYQSGEIVAFIAPKDHVNDKFPDGLTLRSYPNTEHKSLEELGKNAISAGMPGMKLKSNEKLNSKETEYLKGIIESEDGNVSMVMYSFIKKDQIYFLQLVIEKKNWEKFSRIGDDAFNSLTIK